MRLGAKSAAAAGFAFGVVLGYLSFLTAGAGHGTYVMVGMSSAPLGLLGFLAAIFGSPLVWAGVGALLASLDRHGARRWFIVFMFVHYLGGVALLSREPFGDWEGVGRVAGAMPWVVAAWLTTYGLGQAMIWLTFTRAVVNKQAG